jgi:hypothetical protein
MGQACCVLEVAFEFVTYCDRLWQPKASGYGPSSKHSDLFLAKSSEGIETLCMIFKGPQNFPEFMEKLRG